MKSPFETKYRDQKESLAEAAKRRAKRSKANYSSMTTDDSKDEDGNSRLSSSKKVTNY